MLADRADVPTVFIWSYRHRWCGSPGGVGSGISSLATGCGGCGLESSLPSSVDAQPDLSAVQGDRSVSVQADVGLRSVLVHHPDSVRARAPLVMVLHGEGSSAELARKELGWNAVVDREGFVVAYPEGVNYRWNAGPTCCFPNNAGVNDIGFLNEALSALTKQDLIDRSRVYAVGFSVGVRWPTPGNARIRVCWPGSARSTRAC